MRNTLIIVTSDHSDSLTINGYPDHGNNILGISNIENATYETLTYTNGPG
jgi:alkaline phosphatase